MKRSKKPLTFAAIAASIGALSLAVEACVYGPPNPRETNVYGPPPDETSIEQTEDETKDTLPGTKPGETSEEACVYGPPPDETLDGPEVDVDGPPPGEFDEPDGAVTVVYGPPSTSES